MLCSVQDFFRKAGCMHVEVFLPLTDGLLITSWGHADNDITCANVKFAALIIATLKLLSISKLGFRRRKKP